MDSALLAFLDQLARFGEEHDARDIRHADRMLNITPDTGRFLWTIAIAKGAARILEIGTSNGYSTAWLADVARQTGGLVTTIESNPEKIQLARENLTKVGLDGFVDFRHGLAIDVLPELQTRFDLIFLDADRANYVAYLQMILPMMRTGSLLVTDNAISHAHELQEYLALVKSQPSLFSVTVPIGKGEELSVKIAK